MLITQKTGEGTQSHVNTTDPYRVNSLLAFLSKWVRFYYCQPVNQKGNRKACRDLSQTNVYLNLPYRIAIYWAES